MNVQKTRKLFVLIFEDTLLNRKTATIKLEGEKTRREVVIDWKSLAKMCGATPEEIENASIEIEQL